MRTEETQSRSKANARPANFLGLISGKDFREGIVAHYGQFPAEALGEVGRLCVFESAEDAVAE